MTTDYTHPAYKASLPKWVKVRDACAGEDAVKAKTTAYLPNPDETNSQGPERYNAYLTRAVYFNTTGRTLAGLLGVAYANWPQVDVSASRVLLQDADGSGVGLINQSQAVLSDVLQTGRAGLLADYTRVDEISLKRAKTVAEQELIGLRPLVIAYPAESILTWESDGNALSRVVLSESYEAHSGGEIEYLPQLRELLMEGGKYVVRIWRRLTAKGEFTLVDTVETSHGFIPFAFIGATNNDASPDQPPLLDLANLNLAHYRNSADFEESAFLLGQPQLVVTGVDEEWQKTTGRITMGCRGALALPVNADAKLLQVAPNTLAKEAMLDKERMMQALGARLLSQTDAVKTATQSASETKAAYSQLSLACDNVSAAYTKVLQWLDSWRFPRSASKASFAIDTRFNDLTLDANAIRETVAAWQAGLVPQSDAVAILQRLGVIDQGKTAEQVQEEVEAQGPALNLDEAA